MRLLMVLSLLLTACVDGTTPNCTAQSSGCYPGDAGSSQPDAGDASSDGSPVTDGAVD